MMSQVSPFVLSRLLSSFWVSHTGSASDRCALQEAFSVVSPSTWNDLPVELHSLLMAHPSKFYISSESFFFGRDWAGGASE